MLRVSGGSNSIKVERRTQRESSDNWGRVRRRWIPQDLTCNLLVNSCPCPMGESGGDDNVERPVCTQYQAKQGVRLSYQLEGWGRGLVGGGGGGFAIRDGSLFRGLRRGITVLALACLMGSNGWAIGTGGSGGSLMKVETLPWSMWVEEMVCKDPSVHIAKQKGGLPWKWRLCLLGPALMVQLQAGGCDAEGGKASLEGALGELVELSAHLREPEGHGMDGEHLCLGGELFPGGAEG
ncbi:hypothetical protein EDD17DRAFT_1504614 [Pisolithus thermaeus]|nr:hypothetical protein EDD17DRAFT_1504614 [Pisolithus thermaeus]